VKRPAISSPTVITLVALAAGIGLGLLVFRSGSPKWLAVADHVSAFGTLWTNALRLTVVPLVVSTLIVAIAGHGISRAIGRIAGLSFVTFASLLAAGAMVVIAVVPPVLSRLNLERRPVSQEASRDRTDETRAGATSFKDLISTLLPSNLVKAATEDDLLALVVFSIFVGLATTRINPDQSAPFIAVVRGLAASMRVIIGWILWLMPVAVFAFSFVATANIGLSTAGILGSWLGIAFLMAAILMIGLYAIAVLIGRVTLRSFAKSLLPAQEVGIATRSSLAALPALLEGARTHLHRDDAVTSVTLPLAVSSFKINRTINSVARLLFLSYVYNVPLGMISIATFSVAALLMSFSSPGIPSRGPSGTLPLYLAAGIPMEGIVLLRAVESIADFAMTTLNITADMTAMTIVGRFVRQPAGLTESSA
jgi:proton glutamate symport protein